MPCGAFEDAARAGEAVAREVGGGEARRPRRARVCSCLESAASRRNSHSPAACVPAEPNACCICVGVRLEQAARPRRRRRPCPRCRSCGRSGSASGRGTRRRGCRLRSRPRWRSARSRPEAPIACATASAGGKDDGRRMEHRAVVHVVLLGEVRGRRVDHRGEQRRLTSRGESGSRTGRSAGPMRLRRTPRCVSTGRAPLPASAEPNQSRNRSSVRSTTGARDALEPQRGGEVGQRRARGVGHDRRDLFMMAPSLRAVARSRPR